MSTIGIVDEFTIGRSGVYSCLEYYRTKVERCADGSSERVLRVGDGADFSASRRGDRGQGRGGDGQVVQLEHNGAGGAQYETEGGWAADRRSVGGGNQLACWA